MSKDTKQSKVDVIKLVEGMAASGLSQEQIIAAVSSLSPASAPSINTTSSIKSGPKIDYKSAIARAAARFQNEERVPVTIAKPYGKYTGGFIKCSLNGVGLALPCNGKTYQVPKSLAIVFKDRINSLDELDSDRGPSMGLADASEWFGIGGLKPVSDDGKLVKVDEVKYE